ncbi:type I 3-dehydroquinate dehydratase [Virgibacillus sediminis]|uniref:3-dehydroquinate dehydratase n=1 Tax=Virgibacillus sediminis TaxID=202260 RepID=A0ABV7A2I3_9BACI
MKVVKVRDVLIGEGTPKVIIPLMGRTDKQLAEEVAVVKESEPDMVEWRADVHERVDCLDEISGTAAQLRKDLGEIPLLFTFRTDKEGGNRELSEDTYFRLLSKIIDTGMVDVIDVEYFADKLKVETIIQQARENDIRVILSNHDFDKTPEMGEILSRLQGMQEMGADIPKIAVMPRDMEDLFTLLQATSKMSRIYADRPIITMAMGKLGLISRLAGEVFGSAATFGSGKEASAPGQIAAEDLKLVLSTIHKYQI